VPARTPFADRSSNNSTSDPSATDDNTGGWDVGSRWINTSNSKVWFAVDVSTGAAVWKDVTLTAASGSHPVTTSASDPTITDDANGGHAIGDHWINTTALRIYQAEDVTIGAAVWERIDSPKSTITTADPTAAADNTQGYEIHSMWINTNSTPPRSWVALDVSTGAAVWVRATNIKSNVSSIDPTVGDDANDDYEVGSQWYNQVTHDLFVLVDATVGAAQWRSVSSEAGAHVLKGTAGFGSLLDYPAVGSLAADQIQYIAVRLFSGKIYDRMVVFIDSGGTAGRDIQLGVYDQATPSDSIVDPDSRVAQTDVVNTNVTQPGFYIVQLTDGAGTPQTFTVPDPGVYWLAATVDSNAVKFAATNQYRADYLPKRAQFGVGGLPASAGALSNPAEALIFVSIIEQGVTLPV